MAGKEGAAAGRFATIIDTLEAVIVREAHALLALDASTDAAGVEKTAKAVRAAADAARSLTALAVAVDKSATLPGPVDEDAGTDMDDEDAGGDPDDLQRRRERLVERAAVLFAGVRRADAGDGRVHAGGGGASLAVAGGSRPAS